LVTVTVTAQMKTENALCSIISLLINVDCNKLNTLSVIAKCVTSFLFKQ